jgi:MFS family permease
VVHAQSFHVPSLPVTPVELSAFDLNLASTMLFAGWVFGASVMSALADRFGRRSVCLAAVLGLLLGDVCQLLAPSFVWYLVARVLVGFGVGGVGVVAYVWGIAFQYSGCCIRLPMILHGHLRTYARLRIHHL